MAKRNKATESSPNGQGIVINEITVAQVTRGNQDVQSWFQAIKAAESTRMPNRKSLYNTYTDVAIDLHLKSVMDKRVRAVKTTPFEWAGLDNEVIIDNFKSPWFSELLGLIQSRIFWGTTLTEITLGEDGLIGDVNLIPRQNVKPEKGIISKDGYSDEGIRYREGIYVNYILEIGKPNELGLIANIAPYILMKRSNLSDFSRYNEMFGMPLRVYEYDPLKPGARDEVTKQAKEYGSAAYIVLPKGAGNVSFHDSVKQSTAYAYDKLHEMLNNEITIGVLGQLLTTGGEGGGSYELGKVHKAVEAAINLEDRLTAEYIINYPFKKNILIPHGYPLEGISGAFKTADEIAKEKKLDIWVKLLQSGAPIAEEDFYKEFGIEPPGSRPVVVRTGSSATQALPDTEPDDPDDEPDDPKPPKGKGGAGKKLTSPKLIELRAHYATSFNLPLIKGEARRGFTLSYQDELQTIIDRIIQQLRSGELKPGDVDPELYELVAKQLFNAVETGYGVTLATNVASDVNMLKALRENVYRFSGFKNYNFLLDANALLLDTNGNVKAFDKFRQDIFRLNKEYNVDHLRTEYNHAVATSQMAGKWKQFEENKGALPLLQYVTVGDARVRTSHASLDGIIKPVDDPFWNTRLPPLEYNCRCTVKQLADGDISLVDANDLPELKKGFGVNWGKERVVFPPSHPQFNVKPEDQANADNNFGLPIPD
jgi:SPP1 gp7 family putative phage head morphogenesis protein